MKVYVVGSLRNPHVPEFGNKLRALGFEVFDDWYASGPEADDKWREYEQARQRGFFDALKEGSFATNAFEYDMKHLNEADIVVLLLPAGKSGHMELGYAKGQGKPAYIVCEEYPERWDMMYRLATDVFAGEASFFRYMEKMHMHEPPQEFNTFTCKCGHPATMHAYNPVLDVRTHCLKDPCQCDMYEEV